jgi:hypothetical protein
MNQCLYELSLIHAMDLLAGPLSLSMQRLPVEIPSQIFAFARAKDMPGHDMDDAYDLGFGLSAVCWQFRRTVRAMPAFWCRIAVDRGALGARADGRFVACLAAAPQDTPLDIRYRSSPGREEPPPDDGMHFFGAMAVRGSLLQRLALTVHFAEKLGAIGGYFASVHAPLLEHLTVTFDLRSEDTHDIEYLSEPPRTALFRSGAPRLQEVHFHGISYCVLAVPCDALRFLELEEPNSSTADIVEELRELLAGAARLERLHVHGKRWFATLDDDREPGAIRREPASCPALLELRVDFYTPPLLDVVQVPALRTPIVDSIVPNRLARFMSLRPGVFAGVTTLTLQAIYYQILSTQG